MQRTAVKKQEPLSTQMKTRADKPLKKKAKYDGDFSSVISTGSTLLDLNISGGRVHGGGIPPGKLVEVFGPPSSGKTTLLCEIAGGVHRAGGQIKFQDPESRLDTEFAKLFDLHIDPKDVEHPKTPVDVFSTIRAWDPKPAGKIHGVFTDSTAALMSDLELEDKKDEYSRRAKLLSQECRKTCNLITQKNLLVVFSNQLRQNVNATQFQEKFTIPGGEAVGFYASLRLHVHKASKFKEKITYQGKEIEQTIGTRMFVTVYKSSVWKAYRTAPLTLLDDYGIDDVRENLKYLKRYSKDTTYTFRGKSLSQSLKEACLIIEKGELENELREDVITLWEWIESKFDTGRKKRRCYE